MSNNDNISRQMRSRGPHGLGDPDDTFLRKVEKEVLIPKMVRERSRQEKCTEEFAAFGKCAKDNGLSVVFKCRQENSLFKNCLTKWFYDNKFNEECKQKYLEERAEYRRTGIPKKQQIAENNAK